MDISIMLQVPWIAYVISQILQRLWIPIFEIKGSGWKVWMCAQSRTEHSSSVLSMEFQALFFIIHSFLMSKSTSFRQNRSFSFFCSSPSVSFFLFLLAHLPSFQTLKGVQTSNIRQVLTTTKESALSLINTFSPFSACLYPTPIFPSLCYFSLGPCWSMSTCYAFSMVAFLLE